MDPLLIARRAFMKRISHYGLSVALLLGAKPAFAKPLSTLTSIRISQSAEDHTRVVFDLTGEFEHDLFTLENPFRVVIDLKGTRKSDAIAVSSRMMLLFSSQAVKPVIAVNQFHHVA